MTPPSHPPGPRSQVLPISSRPTDALSDCEGRPHPVRVAIVDAHAVARHGLTGVLGAPSDLDPVGGAATAEEARDLIERERPDVVVVGLNLPDLDALDLISDLRAQGPRIVVFGVHDETLAAERCLRVGASAYVRRSADPTELLRAVRAAAADEVYLGKAARKQILARLSEGAGFLESPPLSHLTDREMQVFRLLGKGLTTREIAERLDLSVKTIDTHRAKLKEKLGVDDSTRLLQRAVEWTQRERRDEDAQPPP